MVVLNRTVSGAALAPVAPSAHLYQDCLHAHREQFGGSRMVSSGRRDERDRYSPGSGARQDPGYWLLQVEGAAEIAALQHRFRSPRILYPSVSPQYE